MLSICQQIWKTEQWPQNWKRSVFIPIPKKDNAKECCNYHTIALISHASKVMLKIPQAKFQPYMNDELPGVQARFRKSRETEVKLDPLDPIDPLDHQKRKKVPEKHLLVLLTKPKSLTVWITANCGKFSKTWDYQTTLAAS